jgi:hypothetical protein
MSEEEDNKKEHIEKRVALLREMCDTRIQLCYLLKIIRNQILLEDNKYKNTFVSDITTKTNDNNICFGSYNYFLSLLIMSSFLKRTTKRGYYQCSEELILFLINNYDEIFRKIKNIENSEEIKLYSYEDFKNLAKSKRTKNKNKDEDTNKNIQ